MKKLLLLLLLFPAFTFAQSLTGKWASVEDKTMSVEFKADGTMSFTDSLSPEGLGDIIIKYNQTVENGVKYLVCDTYIEDENVGSQKNAYKLEGDTLTIIGNAEDVERGESLNTVFHRVKP